MEKTGIDPNTLNRGAKCNNCSETFYIGGKECPQCGSTNVDEKWNSLLSNYSAHDVGEAYFKGRINQLGLCAENHGIDKRHNDEELIFDNRMDLRLWEPLDGQEYPPKGGGFVPNPPLHEEPVDMELFEAAMDELESVDMADFETEVWELRALVDIKTKRSSSWMGKFNLRHLAHYAEAADNYSVPAFLYFTVVDTDAEEVGDESFVIPINTDWPYGGVVDHYDRDCNYQLSGKELNETAQMCSSVKNTFRAPDGNMVVETTDESHHDFDWVMENVL